MQIVQIHRHNCKRLSGREFALFATKSWSSTTECYSRVKVAQRVQHAPVHVGANRDCAGKNFFGVTSRWPSLGAKLFLVDTTTAISREVLEGQSEE